MRAGCYAAPRIEAAKRERGLRTLYYEDIEVDVRMESPWVTVSAEEIVSFAEVWDPHPFHLDEEAGAGSIFGGLSACAAHIFALQSRLSHDLPAQAALVAGLGGDGMQLLSPVLAGQRLRLVRRFTEKRPSRSQPGAGVVGIEHTLVSPEGALLFRTRGFILVACRPSAS